MTQTEMIRAHLLSGDEITPIDALEKYGCFRLAARIKELRDEGMTIKTTKESANGKSWAKYKFVYDVVKP